MMFFRKKEQPIFIYKDMTLTLKLLLSQSSDSTKMLFLPDLIGLLYLRYGYLHHTTPQDSTSNLNSSICKYIKEFFA